MSTYVFTKNGTRERPRNISKSTFNSDPFGTEYLYTPLDNPITRYFFSGSSDYTGSDYPKIRSLKNTINYYNASDDIYNFDNFYEKPIHLICLNSYHLGSGIQKGTVQLNFFQSGSLLDVATDKNENGVLYNNNNEKIGIVLYKEGFFIINNTASINNTNSIFTSASVSDNPRWIYYMTDAGNDIYFQNNFRIVNELPTETLLCYADKGQLNHSNNPSYIKYTKSAAEILYNLNFSLNYNSFYISLI